MYIYISWTGKQSAIYIYICIHIVIIKVHIPGVQPRPGEQLCSGEGVCVRDGPGYPSPFGVRDSFLVSKYLPEHSWRNRVPHAGWERQMP